MIPVLNEATTIAGTLTRLRRQLPTVEILVADGGSDDDTVALAAPLARVISTPRGRSRQMNTAAAVAQGAWLLFLHADTQLPTGFGGEIGRIAEQGGEAGAFPLRIAGAHPFLPLLAWGATWRTRLRRVALGDQAIFLTRQRFEAVGGFPELALMEDYALTLRLKRLGVPLHLARTAVITSGRRWDELGFFRVWWHMRFLYARYHLLGPPRVPPAKYTDVR